MTIKQITIQKNTKIIWCFKNNINILSNYKKKVERKLKKIIKYFNIISFLLAYYGLMIEKVKNKKNKS